MNSFLGPLWALLLALVLAVPALAGQGIVTIYGVTSNGGSPPTYTCNVSSSAGITVGDHVMAKTTSAGATGVWLVTSKPSATSVVLQDSLTQETGTAFGAPLANVTNGLAYGTPESGTTMIPDGASWWAAAARRNYVVLAEATPSSAALTKTDDTNVTLTLGGTPATALLQATSLTLGWTGQLSVARGGTGLSALGSALQVLRVNGAGNALEFATLTLSPGWDDILASDATSGPNNPSIDSGQRIIFARAASNGISLASDATRTITLGNEAGAAAGVTLRSLSGLTLNGAGSGVAINATGTPGDLELTAAGATGLTGGSSVSIDGGGIELNVDSSGIDVSGDLTYSGEGFFDIIATSLRLSGSGGNTTLAIDGNGMVVTSTSTVEMTVDGDINLDANTGTPGEGAFLHLGGTTWRADLEGYEIGITAKGGPLDLSADAGGGISITAAADEVRIRSGTGTYIQRVPQVAITAGTGSPTSLDSDTQAGARVTNAGTTVKAACTLPSAVAGLHYYFDNVDSDGLRINAATGDDIRMGDLTCASAGYFESVRVGSSVHLVAVDATTWVAVDGITGTWRADSTTSVGFAFTQHESSSVMAHSWDADADVSESALSWSMSGRNLTIWGQISFTGAPPDTVLSVTLPTINGVAATTATSLAPAEVNPIIGEVVVNDSGTGLRADAHILASNGAPTSVFFYSGTTTQTSFSASSPITWATGDQVFFRVTVPVQ